MEQPDKTTAPRSGEGRLGLLDLGWVFLQIGAGAFGGLGASLALMEQALVDRRRVLTRADITEALTYTKLLPGSTGPQVASYLGYELGGWPGSALATACFVLPAGALMVLLAVLYLSATAVEALGPTIQGVTAAVVGILLSTIYRLGMANIHGPLTLGIMAAAFVAVVFLDVNAGLVVVAAGALGVVVFAREASR